MTLLSDNLQVTVTESNVDQLLPAADQFLVQKIKDKCCTFLEEKLTIDNCIKTRSYARYYSDYMLINVMDTQTNISLRLR